MSWLGDFLHCWSEPIEHVVVSLASIIGGAWVVIRLIKERGFDSALTIEVSPKRLDRPENAVFINVKLSNVGKVELRAKPCRPSDIAYRDNDETVSYSCTLSLKRIPSTLPPEGKALAWFDQAAFSDLQSHDINLLTEYEDPEEFNAVDFWMEPGETYNLGALVHLSRGSYLGKVTFIGSKKKEFWSRIFPLEI